MVLLLLWSSRYEKAYNAEKSEYKSTRLGRKVQRRMRSKIVEDAQSSSTTGGGGGGLDDGYASDVSRDEIDPNNLHSSSSSDDDERGGGGGGRDVVSSAQKQERRRQKQLDKMKQQHNHLKEALAGSAPAWQGQGQVDLHGGGAGPQFLVNEGACAGGNEAPVAVDPEISANLKQHQKDGIRFMWEQSFSQVRNRVYYLLCLYVPPPLPVLAAHTCMLARIVWC